MNTKNLQRISVTGLAAILLLPVLFVTTPALAEPTYSVMVTSQLKGYVTPISVPIIMDGQPTNHNTPWNFTGLTGVHNFTVPYEHPNGHPFRNWNTLPTPDCLFTTITLSAENASSNGAYCAYYNRIFNATSFIWPQNRYFVTPNDPAVIAAAGNMTWEEIVDWVATNITPNNPGRYQFPNETLAVGYGVCREYSGLAVSMLIARGYEAYVVAGNTTGFLDINHAWIALKLNDTLYHYEPQNTLDNQPEPLSWANDRTAWYLYNDKVFIPATATQDLPAPSPTDTYKVTIKASDDGPYKAINDVHTRIYLDGKDTGRVSPHTFTGLKGNHTFTVGYHDGRGKPFYAWSTETPGNRWFPSIVTTQQGSYCAVYLSEIDQTHPSPAQRQYFITPQDKAVVAAASDKNWSQIVDYISSLAYYGPHDINNPVLFPNQTLNGGYYLPDYALLCCSMLLANGYTAYYAGMTENPWTAWVVIDINGTLTPINPYKPITKDYLQSIQADFFLNQTGIYPAIISDKPNTASLTPSPSPSAQSSTTSAISATTKPTLTTTPNPNSPSTAPTEQPQATPEPSATIPETPAATALLMLLPTMALITISIRKIGKDRHKQVIA